MTPFPSRFRPTPEDHARVSLLSVRPNVFHYSSYWGAWSRVLTPYNRSSVVELNLTPVNDWDDVRQIIFRSHCTSLGDRDDLREALPENVREYIANQVGEDLTQRLLLTDWLPLLDMTKVHRGRIGGGGLPFDQCRKAGL